MSRLRVHLYTLLFCGCQFVMAPDEVMGGGVGARSMDHMLFVLSRLPENDFDASVECSSINVFAENIALYPLSQNCAMDNKALFDISGKI